MRVDGNMKRDKKSEASIGKKPVFSEQEYIEYLEERFRKLGADEQKFRDEVLTTKALLNKNSNYTKRIR